MKHFYLLFILLSFIRFENVVFAETRVENNTAGTFSIFDTREILDESTLETKVLQDWHVCNVTGKVRQKLIEINVAEWWPGQDYRIPVRMIVPLNSKAKGFHITGANEYKKLMQDVKPSKFDSMLLENGVGIVKTVVKPLSQIPGKEKLESAMNKIFIKGLNTRHNLGWIWPMTLMRATTAAFAEVDHFEKGKVVGSGGSKNGISPAAALINDERFTATCSRVAFAYASPIRMAENEAIAKVKSANRDFFKSVENGEINVNSQKVNWLKTNMVGNDKSLMDMALKYGVTRSEIDPILERIYKSLCVTENWDQLNRRGVDMLFQPATHDWVAYDILWGAQHHPQLPVYYVANGGHQQKNHIAAEKDNQNLEAFIWNHFFGGEKLMLPPGTEYVVKDSKVHVSVRFPEGTQPSNGRIWWMYDRAPAGSAPFLFERIPEDQWVEMKLDDSTGNWVATLPLKKGASTIDFFSNHGAKVNNFQQYISSPYTRIDVSSL